MAASISSPAYAHCCKAAERACTGCKDAPAIDDDPQPVYYCSSACQKEDWQNHKKNCKRLQTRKLFYRAGSVLQEMFYMYREKMFDKSITRIEKTGTYLIVYEGEYNALVSTKADILVPFPEELCKTEQDKKCVLVHLACDDASAWMHDILKYVLTGIASDITEVRGVVKNKKLDMIAINALKDVQNTNLTHEILKIKLLNGGEEYALDLTGAQYGYFDPIVPWKEYLQTRISRIVPNPRFNYFGGTKDRLLTVRGDKDTKGMIIALNAESCQELISGTKEWEKLNDMTILKMIKLPLDDFKAKEKQLVGFIAQNLGEYHAWLREQAVKDKVDTASVVGRELTK